MAPGLDAGHWPLKLSAGLFYLHDRVDFDEGQIVFSSPTTSARTQANLTAS